MNKTQKLVLKYIHRCEETRTTEKMDVTSTDISEELKLPEDVVKTAIRSLCDKQYIVAEFASWADGVDWVNPYDEGETYREGNKQASMPRWHITELTDRGRNRLKPWSTRLFPVVVTLVWIVVGGLISTLIDRCVGQS